MATIYNELDYTFSPTEQQEIQKSAAWQGVEKIYTQQGKEANHFHFYADEDFSNYLFSVDTDADGECITWDNN
jgi:hypothetical protein